MDSIFLHTLLPLAQSSSETSPPVAKRNSTTGSSSSSNSNRSGTPGPTRHSSGSSGSSSSSQQAGKEPLPPYTTTVGAVSSPDDLSPPSLSTSSSPETLSHLSGATMTMDIQCPVCFSRWSDGVTFCVASACGHSVCQTCSIRVQQCPTCRKPIGSSNSNDSKQKSPEACKDNFYVPNYILNDWIEMDFVKSTPTLSDVFARTARDTVDAVIYMVRREIDAMASGERPRVLRDTIEFIFDRESLPGGGDIGDIAMEAICSTIQSEIATHFGESFMIRVSGVMSTTRIAYTAIKVRAQLRKGFSVPSPSRRHIFLKR